MTLDDLMRVPYVANGRDPAIGVDCYGGVRLVRYHLFGKDMMPDYTSVYGSDKRAMTEAALSAANNFSVVEKKDGAIAAAWQGRLCTHVAIVISVDGALMILEWDNDAKFPRLVRPEAFERKFSKVVYYDN